MKQASSAVTGRTTKPMELPLDRLNETQREDAAFHFFEKVLLPACSAGRCISILFVPKLAEDRVRRIGQLQRFVYTPDDFGFTSRHYQYFSTNGPLRWDSLRTDVERRVDAAFNAASPRALALARIGLRFGDACFQGPQAEAFARCFKCLRTDERRRMTTRDMEENAASISTKLVTLLEQPAYQASVISFMVSQARAFMMQARHGVLIELDAQDSLLACYDLNQKNCQFERTTLVHTPLHGAAMLSTGRAAS